MDLIEAIWEYYLASAPDVQDDIKKVEDSIQDIARQISNMLAAIKDGLKYDIIKNDLERVTDEKQKLLDRLNVLKYKSKETSLTREAIFEFLTKFFNGEITNLKCQEKLLDSLVNSVKVYNDRVEVAVNYIQPNGELYFKDAVCNRVQKWSIANELQTIYIGRNVFIFEIKLPFLPNRRQ